MNLNEDNITFGIDGGKWIITNRQKIHNNVKIPLLPIAEELIEKYKEHINTKKTKTLFPNTSNKKLNSSLKEIAYLCKIKKNLTCHIARHTFATTINSNGI
ncbi:tyrosine-type recombinase/integrase [Seonamhaeicola algicola]|uniref:Tyrosine-type recombinase/integrase n=2 Tax=Seonamhaeicola TaxID=1649495 RepID=A0A5C7ATW7_9FLAO|nr:tyrosine-type recombinase/integrase [Seonamhaeicola algicola]